MLYLDPSADTLVAKLSTWPTAQSDALSAAHSGGAEAICDALRIREQTRY